jgi:hypothetical protein
MANSNVCKAKTYKTRAARLWKLLLHVVLLCEMFCSVSIVLWNVWPNVDAQQVGKYFGETCTILAHSM